MAMNIECAPQDVIEKYSDIAVDFFDTVLGMHYNSYLITDESYLSDFSFCGDFTDECEEEINEIRSDSLSMRPLYEAWDEWVIDEINKNYGIKLERTTISLV
jgi:hypothetical protein